MDNVTPSFEIKARRLRAEGKGAVLDAHGHCRENRSELASSHVAGCFYCCSTFQPNTIEFWLDGDQTAECPQCGIDSVIGDASGFPAADKQFLKNMNEFWFSADA